MNFIKYWILATRPKTLVAGILPVLVGGIIAWLLFNQHDKYLALYTVGSVVLIQIATNYFNDALDFFKGADTKDRLGPKRVANEGLLNPQVLLWGAIVCLIGATAFAIPLIQLRGWPILVIGLVAIYLSYGYTGGPYPLAYIGLGEVFVILFFGIIAVTGTCFVHTGEFKIQAVVAGFQTGLLSAVLIEINNLRDESEDKLANKNTLVVKYGRSFGVVLLGVFLFLPQLLGIYWYLNENSKAFLYPLISVPLALFIFIRILKEEASVRYNRYLALSVLCFIVFEFLFAYGLYSGIRAHK